MVKISITEEHYLNGLPCSYTNCPAALAINSVMDLKQNVYSGVGEERGLVFIYRHIPMLGYKIVCVMNAPVILSLFVNGFDLCDDELYIRLPIEFELDIPRMYLR